MDREYFNIIKTEDGKSDFIRYVTGPILRNWGFRISWPDYFYRKSIFSFLTWRVFSFWQYNNQNNLTYVNCSTFKGGLFIEQINIYVFGVVQTVSSSRTHQQLQNNVGGFYRRPVEKTLSRNDEETKNRDKTQGQKHIRENTSRDPDHQLRTPNFRYHLVSTNTSRPIVGIYLPEPWAN